MFQRALLEKYVLHIEKKYLQITSPKIFMNYTSMNYSLLIQVTKYKYFKRNKIRTWCSLWNPTHQRSGKKQNNNLSPKNTHKNPKTNKQKINWRTKPKLSPNKQTSYCPKALILLLTHLVWKEATRGKITRSDLIQYGKKGLRQILESFVTEMWCLGIITSPFTQASRTPKAERREDRNLCIQGQVLPPSEAGNPEAGYYCLALKEFKGTAFMQV